MKAVRWWPFGSYLNPENCGVLGREPILGRPLSKTHLETTETEVNKNREMVNPYNQVQLDFKGNFRVVFRVLDPGVAYWFITNVN